MGRLVDDLLDVGRITRQQLALQTQVVDMREVIRDALDTVRREAERKELQLLHHGRGRGAHRAR